MALIPRDYQEQAIQSIFDFFMKHPSPEENPLIGLPTGTGKALVIAEFIRRALAMYARQKILVVTHVKELVQQNHNEFLEIWPTAPAGIYSAGLKRKDTKQSVIFCGIASIAKNITAFGRIDLILIDEAHLISTDDESMYMKTISLIRAFNPYVRVIGLTATPWRQGQGHMVGTGGLFTHMCFDVTDMKSFNRFIQEGYLVPLTSKPTQLILDTSGVRLLGGEFNDKMLDLAVNKDEITYAALQETMSYSHDRHSWLVFATSLDHAEKIRQMLTYLGVSCRTVHSKMKEKERDDNVAAWKRLEFTAIINMGVLTTGVNHPRLDLIVMLRPTMSVVLWVQMLGRGTRPFWHNGKDYNLSTTEGRLACIAASPKQSCLVLDFAQNIKRLGPVNDPVLPRKKGEKVGEAPIKICPMCDMYNHISARHCGGAPFKTNMGCGAEFTFQTQLRRIASNEEIIKTDMPIVEVFNVERITFDVHRKTTKPDSIKVVYYCGLQKFNQFVLVEHAGFGRRKAVEWWAKRSRKPLPETTAEALMVIDQLAVPTQIKVWVNKSYPEILDEEFLGVFTSELSRAPVTEDNGCPF